MGVVADAYAKRFGLRCLYYIVPLRNVVSILEWGILSHQRAAQLPHSDISLRDVQRKRSAKEVIVGSTRLHQYANLYFDARNPMMYKRRGERWELCVLTVSPDVLDLPGTVVADRNAASDYVRFLSPREALDVLDFPAIYARDWTDPCAPVFYDKRSKKCAEVLVLDGVSPALIAGACVFSGAVGKQLRESSPLCRGLGITIEPDLFFG